ncbi:bifunctional precorrin-2 dehydrogenase/sirohydrochlorin ferrochelatase [Desulfuromonas sp. CSMB_57]|uniref:precorrin-2 dehydrogenase/sirohydrochlorin ferrochelatase family protein n=1 Tax=Desulfuromonas sp. CSMB_57 TaxID=2807629 RepID=UPI001CD2497A|nr:bifunctional precorrin-2 dehydrogenase/sirohydrochlorin ferrochelatase [Desulfuromonas sp. CSMB_57]
MGDYPVIWRMEGRCGLVVGAGPVGRRKALGLLAAGARVRMVALQTPEQPLAAGIEVLIEPFRPAHLDGMFLAIAATGRCAVDEAVAAAARQRSIPVALAGQPENGDFTLPAVLRRGDLTVTVATAGRSPALAAALRDRLGAWLPSAWDQVLDLAEALRRRTAQGSPTVTAGVLGRLLDNGLAEAFAVGELATVDLLLQNEFGPDCTLARLGLGKEPHES